MCFFAHVKMCVQKREILHAWRHIAVIVFGPLLRFLRQDERVGRNVLRRMA